MTLLLQYKETIDNIKYYQESYAFLDIFFDKISNTCQDQYNDIDVCEIAKKSVKAHTCENCKQDTNQELQNAYMQHSHDCFSPIDGHSDEESIIELNVCEDCYDLRVSEC